MATSTSPLSSAKTTGLPGLSSPDYADIVARRRNATSRLESAMASSALQSSRAKAAFSLSQNQINREADSQREQTMAGLADRGMARSARTAGKSLRDIRDEAARRIGLGKAELTDRQAALNALVDEQRRARDRELALLDADEVRRRADINRMMGV